jgi:hypothetical protein
MVQKALATKGFLRCEAVGGAGSNQIPESKKRCGASEKQPM